MCTKTFIMYLDISLVILLDIPVGPGALLTFSPDNMFFISIGRTGDTKDGLYRVIPYD